ncbi:hypothetical protein ACLQ3C_09920 [Gordonia sp. DT30]|uniref:hypothetical protein n=1 Tax=unclassified Gordonia (in: high G+C Gram-positive bacteria) TaxID=2657482 RepID=UPI003CED197E
MRLRPDLEILATLDVTTIEAVCTDASLITHVISECLDEAAELDDLAEHADGDGGGDGDDGDEHSELACFYRQEAAAWRATAQVLAAAQRPRTSARAGVA